MADIGFTKEQQEVIDKRNANLLVSAAAGSGKTAVLTARILSLITDEKAPVDIDRLLIVTFTKAAASEMRERIAGAIAEYASEHPEDRRMDRQAALLHNAQITTIDSFCLFVVRNNFADIGLDPSFRILDEGERKLLLSDTLAELLEESYQRMEADFMHFADAYGSAGNEERMESMILDLFEYACSDPYPEEWIRKAAADAAPVDMDSLSQTKWYRWGKERADIMIREILRLCKEALGISKQPGGPAAYVNNISELMGIAESIARQDGYERRRQIIKAASLSRLSSGKKKDEDAELRAAAKALFDQARALYVELGDFYPVDGEELAFFSEQTAADLRALCSLCLELMERFSAAKREKALVDFSDMEHFALQILWKEEDGVRVPTKAAEEYRRHFEQIFVDEYQDSNYVQEYVLKSIAGEDNYFCVGDVKQSIYRFRQARPEIFLEKYARYRAEGINCRIDLNRNFRSRGEVLDFVNLVFSVIMKKETAGMDYDDKAKLYLGAKSYHAPKGREYEAEINVLLTDEAPEEDEDTEELAEEERPMSKAELEARMVAERIVALRRDGFLVEDKEEKRQRTVRYRDIVLLSRSLTSYEKVVRRVFEEYDIPFYCNTRSGYFSAIEVKTLLAALRVIDNPRQDQPLHAVLVHFLELFSEEEMALVRAAVPKGSLYDALQLYPQQESAKAEITEKIREFEEWLRSYRGRSVYLKVRELIRLLLTEGAYLDMVSAMPNGAQRRANLKLLMERAADYEQTGYRGLFHFIRYLSQLKDQEIDQGEAGVLDESADVVRMMTIHKSKGLEFPVVFCMGLYKRFNRSDVSAELLMDPELGMALNAVDPVAGAKYPGIKRGILARKVAEDLLAEEMRVLYVALTRAKEKLILTDVRGERRESGEANSAGIFAVKKAGSLMDLVCLALDEAGDAEHYCVYHLPQKDTQKAGKELKRGFAARDILLSGDYSVDEGLRERIRRFEAGGYSHPELKGLFTKTSVSELKHAAFDDEGTYDIFENDRKEAYIPEFARALTESSGAFRGSAYHRFMELLPLESCPESGREQWLKDVLEREKLTGRLSEEYAELIRLSAFEKFLEHGEAERMRNAARQGKLYREQPFFMGVAANELQESFPAQERVLIQGVIDAYWEEEDGLVLLDYKTDRVEQPQELLSRYRVQLELYARALSQIRGMGVKEMWIYAFAFDRFISL